jgi:type IV pilus assembly protein PilA
MLKRLRERSRSESGFTLIELLVVMLILGILAAIAIPAFFNQRDKASDSAKKTEVRTMQTAMETCATDKGGTYVGCDISALNAIEPTIPIGAPAPTGLSATEYTVRSTTNTSSGNWFQIARASNGTFSRTCANPGKGGCGGTTGASSW